MFIHPIYFACCRQNRKIKTWTTMNFSPFGGPFPGIHQFAASGALNSSNVQVSVTDTNLRKTEKNSKFPFFYRTHRIDTMHPRRISWIFRISINRIRLFCRNSVRMERAVVAVSAVAAAVSRINTMAIRRAIIIRMQWAMIIRYHRTNQMQTHTITPTVMMTNPIASHRPVTINRIWAINHKCPNSHKICAVHCSINRQVSIRRKCYRMSIVAGNRWRQVQRSPIICHNCRPVRCHCRCTISWNIPAKASRRR